MNKIWSQNCPVREGPYMIPKWTTERSQSDQIGHQSNGLIGSQNGSIWSQNSRRPQIVSQNHLHLWFVFFGREKITRMISIFHYILTLSTNGNLAQAEDLQKTDVQVLEQHCLPPMQALSFSRSSSPSTVTQNHHYIFLLPYKYLIITIKGYLSR